MTAGPREGGGGAGTTGDRRTDDAPPLDVLPAVDVADGRAVQLVQGVPGSGGEYGDVLHAALRWQSEGARGVHVVDLDAAFGRGSAHDLLARVVGELDVDVQLSGGIRDEESLALALGTGCRRVVLGTAAMEDPAWTESVIERYGDRVAVGLDVRDGTLRSRGWTREGGELFEVLDRLDAAGCERYVVTDVARDGMLAGPDMELLARVCARTRRPVIASGGVACEQDVAALRGIPGIEGVIVGSALYRGRVTMARLLRAAGGGSVCEL